MLEKEYKSATLQVENSFFLIGTKEFYLIPMGAFENSFKRELGKNTGKFISNVVFGDKHSTPYRQVGSARQTAREERLRLAEARAETEARVREQKACDRAQIERKNQLYAIDSAVFRNIDVLNSQSIPTEKPELLRMLSELSVQLKANKWESCGDEAAIRNKYTDALLEKYILCVNELKILDKNEPRLKHFNNLEKKEKRNRFFKKNGNWFFPLIIISVALISAVFYYYPNLLWVVLAIVIGWIGFKIFNKIKDERVENEHTKSDSTIFETPMTVKMPREEQTRKDIPLTTESLNAEEDSRFIDLNENGRIERILALIWNKYERIIGGEILQRKPIFSADGVKDSILYVGVNPSYDPIDDQIFIASSDQHSLMYGSFFDYDDAPQYFKTLEEFASNADKAYTHINLLYARENNREILLSLNHDFIREQLELSYETITKIAPVAIVFFSDYCKNLIFGADRWVDPKTETNGHYLLRGTNIPIFFSDDITVMDQSSRNSLLKKIKSTI